MKLSEIKLKCPCGHTSSVYDLEVDGLHNSIACPKCNTSYDLDMVEVVNE